MHSSYVNWVLMFMGLGSVVLELVLGVATGFDLLLVGLALVLGGLTGILFNSATIGVVTSILLIILYFILGRNLIKHKLKVLTDTKSNSDRLIGKIATVIKDNQVKLDGEIWRAEADIDLKIGAKVEIISVEGTTVKVVQSKLPWN